MKPRRIGLATLTLVTVVALTGCGGSAPHSSSASPSISHTATPTPTPSPTPTPLIAGAIQITRDALVVVSTTKVTMATVPFSSNPEAAAAQLATFIGASASITFHPAGTCSGDNKTAAWGSGLEMVWNTDSSGGSPQAPWFMDSRAAQAGNVAVTTAQGFKVGDTGAAYLAGTPGATQPAGPTEIWSELNADQEGVLAVIDGGKVIIIQSPAYVNQDC